MKLLIITVIVLVIPIFFLFVFVMSTVSKLASLRNRCREIRKRIQAAPEADSRAASGPESESRSDFKLAAEHYNAARAKFPASLLAALCGFHEMEPSPDQPIEGSREGLC